MTSNPNAIAAYLGRRGYDEQIAAIFACEAVELGRLTGAESMPEAVSIVESMFCTFGVQSAISTQRHTQIQKGGPKATPYRPLSAGSWLVK